MTTAAEATVGLALYGFPRRARRSFRRQSRAAANPRDRSLHHSRKRAPAGRRARQTPHRRRVENRPRHPAGIAPRRPARDGWFRAAGSSIPSTQVGGDYFDVSQISPDVWAAVVADVSGKGVSSALLASLLQGSFLMASAESGHIEAIMARLNAFLLERTRGEKYATVFYCTVDASGLLSYANAGHPALHFW